LCLFVCSFVVRHKRYLCAPFMILLKKIVRVLTVISLVVVALVLATFAPIDRTPLSEQFFYQREMKSLDSLLIKNISPSELKAGWAKINITPKDQMPMAGYMPRDKFDSIHDSLYTRLLIIKNDQATVALINVDLLLFPPALKEAINKQLAAAGLNDFIYLSATHTHNAVGGWDESLGGQVAVGDFDRAWVDGLAKKIVLAIQNAELKPSTISYWESDANNLVRNRAMRKTGKKDGWVRGLVVQRQDSSNAVLYTYSAHATNLSRFNNSISADYPGKVIQKLEQQYDFGMFMAGMVGSHSFIWFPEKNHELVDVQSTKLYAQMDTLNLTDPFSTASIEAHKIPIEFGPSQMRINKNWKVRNWVLSSTFGGLEGDLTYLRIGNTLMVGTPCDFSGEIAINENLHGYAKAKGLNLIITSFNGNYVGYITHDANYDMATSAEVYEMNWVGPYHGQYFAEMIKKLIDKSTVDRPLPTETH
jgi:neutral ceramidase